MFRTIVGAYGESGAVARYRARHRAPLVIDEERITVAAAPAPDSGGGARICILDGVLRNQRELERALGVAPGSPEQVIVASYARWGIDALQQLRGEFTFLIWDPMAREGIVARDHLGARPLFLYERGEVLLFGSEVRDLLALLAATPPPDRAVLGHWLTGRYFPDGTRTMFDGVRALPPAHCLTLRGGRWQQQRYWTPGTRPMLRESQDELVARLAAGVETAVSQRIGEDDTAAISLSGGVDSSTVAAFAARSERPVRAYTMVFPDNPALDEWSYVERTCRQLEMPVRRMEVRAGSLLSGALEHVGEWRLPHFPPTFVFARQLLAHAAADGCTVLLDGEGGDEVFGVSPYVIADRVRQGRLIGAVSAAHLLLSMFSEPSLRYELKNVMELGIKGAVPYGAHRLMHRVRPPSYFGPPFLRPEFMRLVADTTDDWHWKRHGGSPSRSHQVHLLTDFRHELQAPDYFRRRAQMSGIDVRPPLLDVDLVELALQIPPEHLLHPSHDRALIREATRGMLPEEVRLRRRKSEFSELFRHCLGEVDLPAIRALLGPGARLGEFVDLSIVESRLLAPSQIGGWQSWAFELWWLTTAECWLRSLEDVAWGEQFASRYGVVPPVSPMLESQDAAALGRS